MCATERVPKDCLPIVIFQFWLLQSFCLTFPMIPKLSEEGCNIDVLFGVEYSEINYFL